MGSLGMRMSQDNVDVKTGLDKEMVLTSKYSIFKGSIQDSGSESVSRDGTPKVVTIPHGLGYIPMVQAMFSDSSGGYWNTTNYLLMPVASFDGSTEFLARVTADATNVYLTFIVSDIDLQTIGNPAEGATEYNFGDESPARVLLGNTYIASDGDILESISFYAKKKDATEGIDVGLYRIESGLPTTLLASGTVSVDSSTMQVWTVDMGSISLVDGHEYGVAIGGFGGNESAFEYNTTIPMDSGSGNQASCRETTEQSLPASWDHDAYRSTIPSVWATITRAPIDINYSYTIFIDKAKL